MSMVVVGRWSSHHFFAKMCVVVVFKALLKRESPVVRLSPSGFCSFGFETLSLSRLGFVARLSNNAAPAGVSGFICVWL